MAKGYRNYRGRTSKGKIALAILLVFIILAALSALAMQRYIAYDETGAPFFRLPERPAAPAPPAEDIPPVQVPEPADSLEVIVPEPETPPAFQVYSLTAAPLTPAVWEAARAEKEAAKAEAEREAAARAEEEAAAQAGLVLFSQEDEASPEEEAPPVSAPGEPDYGQAEALPAACQDKNPGNAAGDSQS